MKINRVVLIERRRIFVKQSESDENHLKPALGFIARDANLSHHVHTTIINMDTADCGRYNEIAGHLVP